MGTADGCGEEMNWVGVAPGLFLDDGVAILVPVFRRYGNGSKDTGIRKKTCPSDKAMGREVSTRPSSGNTSADATGANYPSPTRHQGSSGKLQIPHRNRNQQS